MNLNFWSPPTNIDRIIASNPRIFFGEQCLNLRFEIFAKIGTCRHSIRFETIPKIGVGGHRSHPPSFINATSRALCGRSTRRTPASSSEQMTYARTFTPPRALVRSTTSRATASARTRGEIDHDTSGAPPLLSPPPLPARTSTSASEGGKDTHRRLWRRYGAPARANTRPTSLPARQDTVRHAPPEILLRRHA